MPRDNNNAAAELEALRAELAALKARAAAGSKISYKVSEKGACSVYGLGRFPVTLYRGQWERLLSPDNVEGLKQFLTAHAADLATKD